MAILYKVFPLDISGLGSSPIYHTTVTAGGSANESRNIDWQDALWDYDLRFTVRTHEHVHIGLHFFHTCYGKGYGFLIKDLADYDFSNRFGEVEYQILTGLIPAAGGRTEWQIFKTYQDELARYVRRDIYFPIPDTVSVKIGGVEVNPADYTVDYTTGVIEFDSAPANGSAISVKCEFYTAVRFETDRFPAEALTYSIDNNGVETGSLWQIEPIPLVALRYEEVIGEPS